MADFISKRWLSKADIARLSEFRKAIMHSSAFLKNFSAIGPTKLFYDIETCKLYKVYADRKVFDGCHKNLLLSFRTYGQESVVYVSIYSSRTMQTMERTH